jgi:hypothetical protein
MSGSDPGHASGNQTYVVLPICSCGHGAYFHKLDGENRKACSVWDGVKCGCRAYDPKKVDA